MEQTLPMALQVALYVASGAIVVAAVVLVRFALRLSQQLDRAVIAMERVEGELVPLARGMRVLVDQLHEFSEKTAEAASGLLLPFRAVNRSIGIVQTGVTSFLQALWNGPPYTGEPRA